MPWKITDVMDQKTEFISLYKANVFSVTELCKRFNISRPTGYKWINRLKEDIDKPITEWLRDRSTKPKTSPCRIDDDIEGKIVDLRIKHPRWGSKKLIVLFKERYPEAICPSRRTFDRIFAKRGLLNEDCMPVRADKRFEYSNPNDLWQMDYKGDFCYGNKRRCYPLNILDDNSRYNIAFDAHERISWDLTKNSLIRVFEECGLPDKMLMDRGAIWYSIQARTHWTRLTVWLMRLGIHVMHSRGGHPQTLGKTERLNRTYKYDCIKRTRFEYFDQIQPEFDRFRHEYNHLRPHEAISFKRPAEIYKKSEKEYPGKLPAIEYPKGAIIRKLNNMGLMYYRGKTWFISEAIPSQPVLLKESDDCVEVYFMKTLIKKINLRESYQV